MVNIKEKKIGNKLYYYIEHTIRKNKKFKKREKYIGKTIPKDIENIKKEFLHEIYKEKWYPLFKRIKKNFSKEEKVIPYNAKEKEIESFMIKFTYNTQKIEGSRLTLKETADLLEKGITPKSKPIQDVKEAETHKNIFYEMLNYKKDLNLNIILEWHYKLFKLTKLDIAGKIRKHQVEISRSKFVPPTPVELYPLINDFFKWFQKNRDKLNPVELAALVHLKFVAIHPFTDGNGRISRIMTNFILKKNNYPMFNISYKNRSSYYNALERSQINKMDYIYVRWFFRNYVKQHKKYLK